MRSKPMLTGPAIINASMTGIGSPASKLKIFDPNTFDAASSTLPFFALTNEMTASGKEVAAAIMTKATINGGMPIASAKSIACSVKKYVATAMTMSASSP